VGSRTCVVDLAPRASAFRRVVNVPPIGHKLRAAIRERGAKRELSAPDGDKWLDRRMIKPYARGPGRCTPLLPASVLDRGSPEVTTAINAI
jgi:hypothetical protein